MTKATSSKAGQALPGRILVAEDNKAIGDLVSRILGFMGFEAALARNGVEALSLFLKNSFDLVLTDLEMPIMDGWSLSHCIKERSPNTPVVLMTGADRETVSKKVERGSVDSVIFKPFRLEDLQRTVQGALAFREGGHGIVGVGRENRAMRVRCLSCGQAISMDHQAFSNFRGSLKCLNCRGVMEIQTIRGVLIWGYPLSDMNPDFAARRSEYNLYAGQKRI